MLPTICCFVSITAGEAPRVHINIPKELTMVNCDSNIFDAEFGFLIIISFFYVVEQNTN